VPGETGQTTTIVGRVDTAAAVAAHLPGLRVQAIDELGRGLENVAFRVRAQRDLVVRFPLRPDPAAIAKEARLLQRVAEVSPLPVPEVAFFDELCLAYWFVRGRPLEPEDGVDTGVLKTFLERLHELSVVEMAGLVPVDHDPLRQWHDEAAEIYEDHAGQLAPAKRKSIERFLAEDLPEDSGRVVFSHNDLGIEHVLVDGAEITGIIDWSDAAICDPAYDYGLLLRDLADRAPQPPDDLQERALFYAKCSAIEDFAYRRDRGVRWLF
jgi:aminoglycoside phosphotransferase (APT) family kinase protein